MRPMRKRQTVIVADDDPVCREFCLAALFALGFKATATQSNEELIKIALDRRPDIILTDCHLPDGMAVHAIKTISEAWPEPERPPLFIGMTGDDSERVLGRMMEAGCSAVLHKPFILDELQSCLLNSTSSENDHVNPVSTTARTDCKTNRSHQLRHLFLDSLDQQLIQLDTAISMAMWIEARAFTHRLCGSAAMAGFITLADRCRSLEGALDQASTPRILADLYLHVLDHANLIQKPDHVQNIIISGF
jgi:DNA-binding response OmpR family regulator